MRYLCIQDLLPLWRQVVHDAVDGPFQGDAADEQDGENHVRERGRKVHHLDTQETAASDSLVHITSAGAQFRFFSRSRF